MVIRLVSTADSARFSSSSTPSSFRMDSSLLRTVGYMVAPGVSVISTMVTLLSLHR